MNRRLTVLAVCFAWHFSATFAYAQGYESSYLTVFGWSKDGKHWAFGEQGDYSGGAVYGETVRAYVIEAAKNKFKKKFEKQITEATVEDESLIESQLKTYSQNVKAKLKAMGITGIMGKEVYKKPAMKWTVGDIEYKQFGSKDVTFGAGGKQYELRLKDEIIRDEEDPWSTQSKFALSIRQKGGAWTAMQEDKNPWRHFIAYNIVYVAVSPDGKHVAVLIEAIQVAFENAKIPHYKAVTGKLP